MNKDDLKTGMWVTLRNGNKYLVIQGVNTLNYGVLEFGIIGETGFMRSTSYRDDLTHVTDPSWDIVRVEGDAMFRSDFMDPDVQREIIWDAKKDTQLMSYQCPVCGKVWTVEDDMRMCKNAHIKEEFTVNHYKNGEVYPRTVDFSFPTERGLSAKVVTYYREDLVP